MGIRLKKYPILAIAAGIVKDLPSYLIKNTAVTDSENMRFTQGKAEKVFGYEKFSSDLVIDPAEKIRHIIDYFKFDGTDILVIVTDDRVKYWDPNTSAFVDIGAYATGATYNPSSTIYNNKLYLTNRNDWVARYDGTDFDDIALISGVGSAGENNAWLSVCWSPELAIFCAVSQDGTNRVMTSPDGITWTARTASAASTWSSVIWSPDLNLFCAVANGGATRVMTSPDGVAWTSRTAAEANTWNSVCWSPALTLFCAVATSGTNRVMTSPDGIAWTARAHAAAAGGGQTICWSPELGLFCSVFPGGANAVMTSSDGITWTDRVPAEANTWASICWSPRLGLFCAVSEDGTNRVMTSPNGTNWTAQAHSVGTTWRSVTWSPELDLFCAVADGGIGYSVMTSFNGTTWVTRRAGVANEWFSICWSPRLNLFVVVALTGVDNRVMFSNSGITGWAIRTDIVGLEGGYLICKAKLIKGFQNFLMLGNTYEDTFDTSQRLRWCKYGDPTIWKNTPAGTGQAGYMDFLEDHDPIVAMELIGNSLAVYKKKGIYLVNYIGPPFLFSKTRVVNDVGALSGAAVVPYGGGHYFAGLDNFYYFDGVTAKPIGNGIKKQFFGELNSEKRELVFGYLLKEHREIWWAYPKLGSDYPNYAYVLDIETGAWSHRTMPACMCMGLYRQTTSPSWDDTAKDWGSTDKYKDEDYLLKDVPKNLIGQTDSYIQDIKPYLTNFDGSDIDGWLKTKLYDLGNPLIIKRLQRIQFLISREGDYNLEVIVRTADNVDETPVEYDTYYYNLQTTTPAYLDLDISARYFQLILRTSLKAQPWKLQGFILHYIERGVH